MKLYMYGAHYPSVVLPCDISLLGHYSRSTGGVSESCKQFWLSDVQTFSTVSAPLILGVKCLFVQHIEQFTEHEMRVRGSVKGLVTVVTKIHCCLSS